MKINLKDFFNNWKGVALTSASVVGFLLITRWLGYLQPLEWNALDLHFQRRPQEPVDKRIVIVEIGEADIQKLKQWPISDQHLADALAKIKEQRPRVIGLDLYRDIPVAPNHFGLVELFKAKIPTLDDIEKGHKKLTKLFRTTPNLIGIEKSIGTEDNPQVAPPPVLKQLDQVAANDLISDGDGVVRRALLYPMPEGNESLPSLGLAVASEYLKKEGVSRKSASGEPLKLGQTVFKPFESDDGGYVRADARSYQILLNFRGPAQSFSKVSFTDILANRIQPDFFRDRIVMIGSQASSLNDLFYTPYSKGLMTTPIKTHGVEIQANLASQIISSVLDDRPLIKVVDEATEWALIIFFSITIFFLGWQWRFAKRDDGFAVKFLFKIIFASLLLEAILFASSYCAFIFGWWIPTGVLSLALVISAITISIYVFTSVFLESKEETNLALEAACTGLWRWDFSTNKLSIIGNCEQLLGLETSNFTGTFDDFCGYVHPTYHEELLRFKKSPPDSQTKQRTIDIEFSVSWAINGLNWLHAKGQVYYDQAGQALKLRGTISKITDVKRTRDNLNEETLKWNLYNQNRFDFVIVLEPDLNIEDVHAPVKGLLGYSLKEEYLHHNLIEFIHPDDIDAFERVFTEAFNNSTKNLSIVYRHRHKDGNWRFIDSKISNLFNKTGNRLILLNSLDISEWKESEAILRDARSYIKEYEFLNDEQHN